MLHPKTPTITLLKTWINLNFIQFYVIPQGKKNIVSLIKHQLMLCREEIRPLPFSRTVQRKQMQSLDRMFNFRC